jgi:hypothetical protein
MQRTLPLIVIGLLACRGDGGALPWEGPDDSDTTAPGDSSVEQLGGPCDERSYPPLVINELVSANVRGLLDEDGDSSDWIELANQGADPVQIEGWGLGDDGAQPWHLPALELDADGLLLVFASGKDRREGELHASFSLEAGGEPVVLTAPDGCTVDRAEPGRLYRDVSFGRPAAYPEQWGYFLRTTPGEPNSTEARPGFAPTPVLDPPPGFYEGALQVAVSSEDPTATLRVSLDGSLPDEEDALYDAPLAVEASEHPAVIRARAWVDGLWPSRAATATYSQQPAILDDGLQVVSLVVDPFDLYDEQTGIYAYGPPDYTPYYPYFGANFWEDWERDLHLQVWTADGELVIDQEAGIKIHGGYTRAFEQKSFRVIARSAYGPDSLDHAFFPKQDQDSFAVMVLEGAGDWCPTHTENAFIDELFRDADGVRFPTIDSQAWEPCAVYLNGAFWGLYAFREKLDEHYIAHHHGADPDKLDRIECTADGTDDWWRVSQGDWEAFDALNSFVVGRDFSDPDQWALLEAMIDAPNLATIVLAEGYWGNTDWWSNNLKLWREREDDARWRWMTFDLSHSWLSYNTDHIGTSVRWSGPGLPIADALEAEDFRVLLANQAAELLATSMVPETALARLDAMHAKIEPLIPAQYERWCGQPPSAWYADVDYARQFVQRRPAVLEGDVMEHLGLAGKASLSLAADPPDAGRFQLTLLELEPPTEIELFTGIPVTVTAVPAEGWSFAGWEDETLGSETTVEIVLEEGRELVARFE